MDADVVVKLIMWSFAAVFIVGGFWNLNKIFMSFDRAIPDKMPGLVTRAEPTRKQKWSCRMGWHEWVCRTDLGGKPDPVIVNDRARSIRYFFEFAAPVCKYCPKQLPPREP